jgi:hypothetical protein
MKTRLQAFIGGAIALIGLRALFWIPDGIVGGDSVYILAGALVGLGLPLGIAMLRERSRAARLAEIYLALQVLGMLIVFAISKSGKLSPSAPRSNWRSLSDVIVPAVLLLLLLCIRTGHGNKNVEQTRRGGPGDDASIENRKSAPPGH